MTSTIFLCTNCDAQFPKWMGQCTECGKWGTVARSQKEEEKETQKVSPADIVHLEAKAPKDMVRIQTGVSEFDRVLGGGLVPGSVVLVGGDPGIGKSTLMLQIARRLSEDCLYISGEESAEQVQLRLSRLSGDAKSIPFIATDRVDRAVQTLRETKPKLAIIDSIQTVRDPDIGAEAGTVTQIRAAASRLVECAKSNGIAIILVGHVTKDGALGGPKTLEHLVDCVLYFEGDNRSLYRLLRPSKNRFGPTHEVGVFDMTQGGLIEVKDPSRLFSENRDSAVPGSVASIIMEGTRAFAIEVQALVTKAAMGYPLRKSVGFDNNRLQLLIAVLQKRASCPLYSEDVHVNIAGGLATREPSVDLAVCLAIASSFTDQALPQKTVVVGEVGLSGEVRMVGRIMERVAAAERLGFERIIMPVLPKKPATRLTLTEVSNIIEPLRLFKMQG